MALAVGCTREQYVEIEEAPASVVDAQGRMHLRATMDPITGETKAEIDGDGAFTWSKVDEVAVYSDEEGYVDFVLQTGEGTNEGVFTAEFDGTRSHYAIYPAAYADRSNYGEPTLNVTLPSAYAIDNTKEDWKSYYATRSPLPMVALNDNNQTSLAFKHVGGIFRLTLTKVPAGTKTIEVTLDKDVTGTFAVGNLTSDPFAPTITAGDVTDKNVVTFTLSEALSEETYDLVLNVPVPEGTFTDLKVTCLSSSDVRLANKHKVRNRVFTRTLGRKIPIVCTGFDPDLDDLEPGMVTVSSEKSIVYVGQDSDKVELTAASTEVASPEYTWEVISGEGFVSLSTTSGPTVTLNPGSSAGTAVVRCIARHSNVVSYEDITVAVAPDAYTVGGKFKFGGGAYDYCFFSKGNLQLYEDNAWKVADNQWDCFGNTQFDNHRDLFGFGTGSNPNITSTNIDDYIFFTDWGDYTLQPELGSKWFSLGGMFCDWYWGRDNGFRSIIYDGNRGNFLFAKAFLFGLYHGLILFPDGYKHPSGVTAVAGVNAIDNTSWEDNRFTEAQWKLMELAGVCFLPAAGLRDGESISDVGVSGNYWTVDRYSSLSFSQSSIGPAPNGGFGGDRNRGKSVRLVQFAEPASVTSIDFIFERSSVCVGNEIVLIANPSFASEGGLRYFWDIVSGDDCLEFNENYGEKVVLKGSASGSALVRCNLNGFSITKEIEILPAVSSISLSDLKNLIDSNIEASYDYIGKVIGANGMIYFTVADAEEAGTIASAMIAYIGQATEPTEENSNASMGTYNHGLAFALSEVSNTSGEEGGGRMAWADAVIAGSAYNRSRPNGVSNWFLPSMYQLSLIINPFDIDDSIVVKSDTGFTVLGLTAAEYTSERRMLDCGGVTTFGMNGARGFWTATPTYLYYYGDWHSFSNFNPNSLYRVRSAFAF